MKKILFALVLIHFVTFKNQAQCSFGNFPPSYTVNPGWTNGAWLAQKYTLASTATLSGLGLNAGAGAGSIPYRMALYTDVSNAPGNLVAASNQGTISVGLNMVGIGAYTVIPAGSYWIMANYGGSGPTTYSPGGNAIRFLASSLSSLPANGSTWNTGSPYFIDYWAVINSPTVTVSGPTLACLGTTVSLNAGGAVSYTWNTGAFSSSLSVSPTTNTVYTVYGSGATGCIGIASQSLTSHVSPNVTISGTNTVCAGSTLSQTVTGASSYTWSTGANTNTVLLSPTSNTVYTVTGSDAVGCTGTATTSITVNPLPVLTVTGNTAICIGASINATVSGASTYTWSTGANTTTLQTSPVTNTSYAVSGTDGNACTGSATLSIQVNALPSLTVNSSQPSLCVNETASLSVTGVTTCTWSTGANGLILAVNPTVSTIYTVSGTDANGCVNTANITQEVNLCTGISHEQTNLFSAVISPNPGTGFFTLNTNSSGKVLDLEIYNSTGILIKKDPDFSGNSIIDLSAQAKGLYYVVVRTNGNQFVVKLIKE